MLEALVERLAQDYGGSIRSIEEVRHNVYSLYHSSMSLLARNYGFMLSEEEWDELVAEAADRSDLERVLRHRQDIQQLRSRATEHGSKLVEGARVMEEEEEEEESSILSSEVRNRRLTFVDRVLLAPSSSYFSDASMKERYPHLYYDMLGRYYGELPPFLSDLYDQPASTRHLEGGVCL